MFVCFPIYLVKTYKRISKFILLILTFKTLNCLLLEVCLFVFGNRTENLKVIPIGYEWVGWGEVMENYLKL